MNDSKKYPALLSVLSGFLLGISVVTLNAWLIWIALVPLLWAIDGKSIKDTAKHAGLFGISSSIIILAWVPGALQTYAGISLVYGFAGMLIAALIMSAWYVVAFGLYAVLRKGINENKKYVWLNVLIFVAVIQSIDFVRFQVLPGFPWDKYVFSAALAKNLYMIQLAPVVGASGLSVLISAVNYLLALAIIQKKWLHVYAAMMLFAANLLYGSIIYHNIETTGPEAKSIGILCENVAAETRWTESGDAIIRTLLDLVEASAEFHPDMLVWSETALPWTFTEDDDILQALAGIMNRNNATTEQMIGYLSQAEYDPNKVYNSAYLINPEGQATARIDKHQLLTFFEEPLLRGHNKMFIPMLTQSVYDNFVRGNKNKLMKTVTGNAWVMICNESLLPNWRDKSIRHAHFLVNISNDAWLENTQHIAHHFYFARSKAVEYRKDMIINSNRGISGIVNKRGEVIAMSMTDQPEMLTGKIYPNENTTFYARFPKLVSYIFLLLTCIIFIVTFVRNIAHSKSKSL